MKKTFIAAALLTAALFADVSHAGLFEGAGQVVESLPSGEINWSDNLVRAVGRGSPPPGAPNAGAARLMAQRAAKVDALRNLLEAVGGVRIDSLTTVTNLMTGSDAVKSRVKGLVKGALVVDTKYLADGAVEVTVEAPISGILAETVYENIPDLGAAVMPKAGIPVNTGLVIDAKGIGVKAAMSPKIVDEDGREVYGSRFVKKEAAIRQGIAAYAKDVNAAADSERVRANPVVIKALRTVGTRGSEIVISNGDSSRLRDKSKNLSFLEETRVVIVMD